MVKREFYPDEMVEDIFDSYLMCEDCEYYHGVNTCDAFVDQIPLRIISGEQNHYLPIEGDNGLQFKRKKEK